MGSLRGKYFWINVWNWTKAISVILLVLSGLFISGVLVFVGLTMIIEDLQETHPVLLGGLFSTAIGYFIYKQTWKFMKWIEQKFM